MLEKSELDMELERAKREYEDKAASIASRKSVSERYAVWKEKNKLALRELDEIRNSCRHSNFVRVGPTGQDYDMCDRRIFEAMVRCTDCDYYFKKEW